MPRPSIPKPAGGDYAHFHATYVALVPDGDVLAHLERHGAEVVGLLRGISETRSEHRYAADKWSIREVVGHLIDAERVFTYRALSFARGDTNPLPGFDENAWGATTNAHRRSLAELIDELAAVRAATLALFRGFSEAEVARSGTASGQRMTVAGLAYVTAGHERHHVRILKERYLTS